MSAVSDAEQFLTVFEETAPDAAVLDVRMPPTFTNEGLRAAIEVRKLRPGFPVLVLSAYVEDRYAGELLAGGAGGVGLPAQGTGRQGGRVRRRIEPGPSDGGTVMDPEVRIPTDEPSTCRRSDQITDPTRVRGSRFVMAEGLGNQEIARKLVVSDTAVSKHIGNIFAKLGLSASESGHRRVLAVLAHLRA